MMKLGLHTKLHVMMATVAVIALAGVAVMFFAKPVFAVTSTDCLGETGTLCWHGYFNSNDYTLGGGNVISDGLYGIGNATDFTNRIGGYLNCGAFPNDQNATGAAFIVLTMLGVPPSGGWTIDKYDACRRFGEWRNKIFSYESLGLINWNANYTYYTNSFYQSAQNDDAYFTLGYTESAPSIVFMNPYNPAQVLYGLRIACGNPVGWHTGLPDAGWSGTGYSSASVPDAFPGEPVTFNHYVHNNGPSPSAWWYGARFKYDNGGDQWVNDIWAANIPNGGNTPTSHSFIMPNVNANQICEHVYFFWQATWNQTYGYSPYACVNIDKPIGTCNGFTLNPAQVMPGQSFTINSSVKYQNTRAANSARNNGSNYTVRVVRLNGGAELPIFQQTLVPTTVDANGDLIGAQVTVPASAITKAGQYRVYYGNYGGLGNIVCGGSGNNFDAAYYPYFDNVGGDIIAGAGFTQGMACTDTPGAGIKGWNHGGPYFGASSQLAALAVGDITSFASAVNSVDGSSTTASPPGVGGAGNNLTFSNVATSGRLGNTSLPCMPDYYTQAVAQTTAVAGTNISKPDLQSFNNGDYKKYTGNVTIGSGVSTSTITADGRQVTIVIDGNAYITGNIIYAPYTDPVSIPRLTLIVRGNIYIAPTVTELHGVYIAQSQGIAGKGTVYTCASGFSAVSDYNTCNNPLKFYGAVAAENIRLGRTYGNLIPVGGTPNAPAESFIYTPELWLSNGGISTAQGEQPYDSISSLPPTL